MMFSFWVVAMMGIVYFSLYKKNIDFFTIAFFSSLIYFIPGFVGQVLYYDGITQLFIPVENVTYIVFIIVLLNIILFSMFSDMLNIKSGKIYGIKENNFMVGSIFLINMSSFLYTLIDLGSNVFLTKSNLIDLLGVPYIIWSVSSIVGLVLSFQSRKVHPFIFFFSIISILVHFVLGDRTSLIIGLMAIVSMNILYKSPLKIIKSKKTIFISLLIVLFGFISKSIYSNLKINGLFYTFNTLFKIDTYVDSVVKSEPFVTQLILNEVVSKKFYIGMSHYTDLIYQLLLTPSKFKNYESFNEVFQSALFADIDYGMAYNFWAEGFASGGLIFVLLLSLLYCTGLFLFNLIYQNVDKYLKSIVIVMGIYWSFYIHRNSMETIITSERFIIYIYVLGLLISFCFNIIINKRTLPLKTHR